MFGSSSNFWGELGSQVFSPVPSCTQPRDNLVPSSSLQFPPLPSSVLQCPPVTSRTSSYLQCPPVHSSVLQCPPVPSSDLQHLQLPPVPSSVLQCPPVPSSTLQCPPVLSSALQYTPAPFCTHSPHSGITSHHQKVGWLLSEKRESCWLCLLKSAANVHKGSCSCS